MIGQRPARQITHGQEILSLVQPDLVDGHDVGVLEQGRRLGLGMKSMDGLAGGQRVGHQQLERDGAAHPELTGFMDDAHPAVAQLAHQFVVAEETRGVPVAGRRWIGGWIRLIVRSLETGLEMAGEADGAGPAEADGSAADGTAFGALGIAVDDGGMHYGPFT